MKTFKFYLIAFTSIILTAGLIAVAFAETESQSDTGNTSEHKFEKAKEYYAECKHVTDEDFAAIKPYLKAFTDVEVMADMMSQPQQFAQLMMVVNDPRTMHVMMKCSMEPVMWETWMRGLSDPAKMMRAASRFMNPQMYFNWSMAPMNPQMYAPMMAMMNPQYYMNWTNAMMNPAFYNPMMAMMDPNWYATRMNWAANPESYASMFNMMNQFSYVDEASNAE